MPEQQHVPVSQAQQHAAQHAIVLLEALKASAKRRESAEIIIE